jgi:transcription initiation factor TFIIIB Brf1 subunit/transcription initiation factor TFIIB
MLLYVVRYVRREKEIAETQRGLAEGENLRHKQLLESTKRQLATAESELKELCEKASSQSVTSEQHAAILKKVSPGVPC